MNLLHAPRNPLGSHPVTTSTTDPMSPQIRVFAMNYFPQLPMCSP